MQKTPSNSNETREHDKQWIMMQVNQVLEPMMFKIFETRPKPANNVRSPVFLL